jgi:L-iditol 2-dehydrogenase
MNAMMRAAVLEGIEHIAVRDVPVPDVGANDVLVRIESVGVCGSDVHYYHEGRIGDFVVEQPIILGHEAAGTIVAVGSAVPPGRVGQRVTIEPQRPCRQCVQCRAGRYNLCPDIHFYATPPIHGAFAQFQTIATDFAYELPEQISMAAGALCEPLSVGVAATRKAGIELGSRLLVSGAGPIGLVMVQVARAMGAAEVYVSDVSAERRMTAQRFGGIPLDPASPDVPFDALEVDAFIDASGAPAAIDGGIRSVRAAGRVVLVGMSNSDPTIPIGRVQSRELLIEGVFRYANTWPQAISLLVTGLVNLDSMVTSTFGLDDVEAALREATLPSSIKVVVNPQI